MLESTQVISAANATEAPAASIDEPSGNPGESSPAAVVAEKKPDPFGPQFAAIARKEKALREQTKAFEERSKRLESLEGLEKTAKDNPLEALQRLGLSYEQITELILTQGEPPKVEDKLAALEKRLAEKEAAEIKARGDAKAAESAAVIQNFQRHVKSTIETAGDKYELINALDQHHEVFSLIESYHETNGKLLTIEEAAGHVEAELEADTRKRLGLKKFANAAKGPTDSNARADRDTSGMTLTNRAATESLPLGDDDELPLDPDERTAAIRKRHRLWAD